MAAVIEVLVKVIADGLRPQAPEQIRRQVGDNLPARKSRSMGLLSEEPVKDKGIPRRGRVWIENKPVPGPMSPTIKKLVGRKLITQPPVKKPKPKVRQV